jgi:hypothetical protein
MSWFSWVEYLLGCAREAKYWSGISLPCNDFPNSTLRSTHWSNTRSGLFGHESISLSEERRRKSKLAKYKKLLGALDLSFSKLPHLSHRDPTSFDRRFLKEFEESFHVLVHVNSEFSSFESFLQTKRFERMDIIP